MGHDDISAWRNRRRSARALLGISLALVIALAIYPRLGALLPECPVHKYLGILCPGCGGTRALIALLHGRIHDALGLNAVFVLLLPFAIWFGAESYGRAVRPVHFEWPRVPGALAYGLGAVAIAFAVVRNMFG